MDQSDQPPVSSTSNNPKGRNQYPDCPPRGHATVENALREYQRQRIFSRTLISKMLREEYGIKISPTTVGRRRTELGLKGSGHTTRDTPEEVKRQLVLDQLAKDPSKRRGPRSVQEAIAHDTGIPLTRDYIAEEMHAQDPAGFEQRMPHVKTINRTPLTSVGPHEEWSGDGHDKLVKIGFPVWGIRDKWSGKWLGLWVVPNNRLGVVIAYLFLCLVEELGGIPIQMTTDCGSETTVLYGYVNALREIFAPEFPTNEVPAHRFLRSVHNITIERGWLSFRLQWGDNVILFWQRGEGIYNPSDPNQYELVQWLWPRLIQQELDGLKARLNAHRVRYDKEKLLPSGCSPNVAMTLHKEYGGTNCLQPVDIRIIRAIKEELGGAALVQFVEPGYAAVAESVFNTLGIRELLFSNVWDVFIAMMPLMYPS